MHSSSRQAAGFAAVLIMLTGAAWGQGKPVCDSQGKIKTPELAGLSQLEG
jgi:hypothetical protein